MGYIRDKDSKPNNLALRSDCAFEDLVAVPGNVDYVHRWLVRAGNQQGVCRRGRPRSGRLRSQDS